MLNYNLIRKLKGQVKEAVLETFDTAIQNQKNPNDFILFLENGHIYPKPLVGLSKYMIGIGLKGIADYDRHDFFRFYLQFPFRQVYNNTKDRRKKEEILKNSFHLELMIYTHDWEAYPNLRMLKQLVNLVYGLPYEWDLELPEFGKQEFIRTDIRDALKNKKLKLANIITRSYNGQLRNAFAHSQYSFFVKEKIELHNYKGKSWEKEFVTYDEWNERFHLTTLLFDILLKEIQNYKNILGLKRKDPAVWVPHGNGHKLKYLYYDNYWNRYVWKENMEKTFGHSFS